MKQQDLQRKEHGKEMMSVEYKYTGTMGCINRLIHSMLLMMKSLCDLPLKMIWNETKQILLIEVVQTYAQKMQYFMVCLEHSAESIQST